jgi:hypothetical protein
MNLSIDIQAESGYLFCTITGNWVTDELESIVNTLSAELTKQKYSRILADMSLVSGPPPEMDRYHMGKYVAAALRGIKMAIIYRKVIPNSFFEDTAVNRGAWIKVFPDKESALQWLMKDQSDKSAADSSQ